METNSKLYHDLFRMYKSSYATKSAAKAQADFNQIWKEKIKKTEKEKINMEAYQKVNDELKEIMNKKKSSTGIMSFFKKKTAIAATKPPPETEEIEMQVIRPVVAEPDGGENSLIDDNNLVDDDIRNDNEALTEKEPACPAQEKLKAEIAIKKDMLLKLIESREIVNDVESSVALSKKIKAVTAEKDELERKLRKKISDQKAKTKQRKNEKQNMENLKVIHPEIATVLKSREGVGRPQIECDQPDILQDILKIATIGAACGDRRREDIFRTVKTLDDLHKAISALGYKISRSALYLRLLPRQSNTREGKRHVKTVNVKLIRPQNNLRKRHPDRRFAAESFTAVDEIAAFIGPGAAVYISQDDKSSVPLGVVAAKRQSAILMNMRIRLRLPDHDFKVGSRHLLTPSVIAVCEIDPKVGVTYSGPTYVAVRSAKHNGSTAYSHNEDLKRFTEIESDIFKKQGSVSEYKPVWMKGVDGGPDENPRFEKNIIMGCKTFRDFDLDCLIEVTNAPGLSAYNRAERRMYPLSKELTGVVLPYDKFGSHLDASGKTVDNDLEVQNFEAAGEVLAELWNDMDIDGHKVTSEFIAKEVDVDTVEFKVTPTFRSRHVFETQYMSVFLKCDDRSCCSALRTMVDSFFPHRRIPALIPVKFSVAGPTALDLEKDVFKKEFEFPSIFARIILEDKLAPAALKEKFCGKIPYDAFFPTQQEVVEGRTCDVCMKYHASKKSLKLHIKANQECQKKRKKPNAAKAVPKQRKRQRVEVEVPSIDVESDVESEPENTAEDLGEEPGPLVSVATSGLFEQILDLREWIRHAWVEV